MPKRKESFDMISENSTVTLTEVPKSPERKSIVAELKQKFQKKHKRNVSLDSVLSRNQSLKSDFGSLSRNSSMKKSMASLLSQCSVNTQASLYFSVRINPESGFNGKNASKLLRTLNFYMSSY